MHAVVCVKQVPDTTEVRIDPRTNTLIRQGVPSIINPYDVHAIEAALGLRDRFGGRVTVISMGPPMYEKSLRKAISYGVDEAILISDRPIAGSDTFATSYVLAQGIRKLDENDPVDIIFCGKQAIDGDTGQVGPGVAQRLGIPLITYVMNIRSVDFEGMEIVAERKLEEARQVVRASLPAVITVEKEINEVRYAPLPELIRAARYQVPVWNVPKLNLDVKQLGIKGSPTRVTTTFVPPPRGGGQRIPEADTDPRRAAAILADKLLTVEPVINK